MLAQVQPGYLRAQLPADAPTLPESFDDVMKARGAALRAARDCGRALRRRSCLASRSGKRQGAYMCLRLPIMRRRFFAWYPSRNSYASILGDFLSSALNPIGFSWAASPACTGARATQHRPLTQQSWR